MSIRQKTLAEVDGRWAQVLWMEPGDRGMLVAGRSAALLECAYSIGEQVLVFCPRCEGEVVMLGLGWAALVHSGECEDRDLFEDGPMNVLFVPVCKAQQRTPPADRFENPRG